MTEFLSGLTSAWAATSNLQIVAVAFALIYIILATKENIWCWPAALVSTGISIYLFWDGRIYMESLLNAYYLFMAVYGWWQWRYGDRTRGSISEGSKEHSTLAVSSFNLKEHGITILLIAASTLVSGYFLSKTDAALPYLDSFTTWAAVVTTWMVTRKVLENWLYWQVINSAGIFLFIDRGFYLYAALNVVYIVISVFGYLQWRDNFKHAR